MNPFNKLPIIIENEVPIESKNLGQVFDLPMSFIIEFEFQLTESYNIDEEQIIFQGKGRFTGCSASICFLSFSKKSHTSMLLK